jgi:hypothetical protein
MQTTSSMVVASVPHLAVGTGLTDCSSADARHSAQWVLQYVESLKNVEAEREGNKSSCTTLGNLFFADVLIFILAALTPWLEATEKALLEDSAARLAADQSLAEEKAALQIADQSSRSYKEANAALNRDLQSA